MKDVLPRYTLRIPQILLDKLGYIADYEGRTKNREIEQLIKQIEGNDFMLTSINLSGLY